MFKGLKLLAWLVLTAGLLIGIDQIAKLPGKSIEQVIETARDTPAAKTQAPQRYLYVDDSGALQFADSLEQVPPKYRRSAQPLAE
jgi:hypothetical protein